MAELTGFQTASQNAIESASQLHTLTRSVSPFQQGVGFRITGFTYKLAEIDGKVDKDARPQPVFTTSIDADLFVRALTRPVPTVDGPLEHKGTFNLFVRDYIASHKDKSDGELLKGIVEECKDKDLMVERVPYVANSRDGRQYATSLVDIYFKA